MKRTLLLVIMALAVLSFSACQTTTIKKIYVDEEEFFEYPHIVESDKILIEDSPERFYSFIRNLKDYLYENETETQFFVKKDAAIYLLDLLPIALNETTVYELRIVEQSIAYGAPINPGGWIDFVVKFPFPKYLLETAIRPRERRSASNRRRVRRFDPLLPTCRERHHRRNTRHDLAGGRGRIDLVRGAQRNFGSHRIFINRLGSANVFDFTSSRL
ncbi:MAG: hypothetical protein MZU97_22685 [Bacillus subtilis]|nr:hypothetical protein [Bacillus subtilis]